MGEPFNNLAWDDIRLIKAVADARSLPAAAVQSGAGRTGFRASLRNYQPPPPLMPLCRQVRPISS